MVTGNASEATSAPTGDRVVIKDVLLALKNPWKAGQLFAIWVVQHLLGDLRDARIVAIALFALLVVGIVLRIIGLDVLFWLPSTKVLPDAALNLPIMRNLAAIEDTKQLRDCAAQARKAGQRYLILSAAEYHRIEQAGDGNPRTIDQRIAYTILPFSDMAATPEDIGFEEVYGTAGRLIAWGGPFDETNNVPGENRTTYKVLLNAKRGMPLTLMTGANKQFPAGFVPPSRNGHSFDKSHDYYHYENAQDEICSYLAVFDSESMILSPLRPELTGEEAKVDHIGLQGKNKLLIDPEPYNFPNSAFAIVVNDFRPRQDAFVSWSLRAKATAPSPASAPK